LSTKNIEQNFILVIGYQTTNPLIICTGACNAKTRKNIVKGIVKT